MKDNTASRKDNASISTDPIDFLERLRPGGPWLLTAIIPDGDTRTITTKTAADVRAFVKAFDGKRNLYYSVNPTRTAMTKKAKKIDIAAVEYALADLDPNAGETSEHAKQRYLDQFNGGLFKPRPVAAVDSGNGVQCLWRLQERIELGKPVKGEFTPEDQNKIDDVEERIAAIMQRLGARTGTQNIDRVLRLPGTINLPNATKRSAGRKRCSTKLLWFEAGTHPLDAFPKPAAEPVDNVVDMHGNPFKAHAFGVLWRNELQEIVERGVVKGERSSKFHFVCCALFEHGWSCEKILTLLRQHPHGIAERYTTERRLDRMVTYSFNKWSKIPREKIPDVTVETFLKPKPKPEPSPLGGLFLEELQQLPVEPLEWIVPEFFLAEAVNGFYGQGAVGKDMLLLQLGMAMSCNALWLDMLEVKQGKVLYFVSEDSVKELRRRETRITEHLIASGRYEPRPQALKLVPLAGRTDTLLAKLNHRTGLVDKTEFYDSMRKEIETLKPDLVIVGNRVNIFAVNQIDDAQVLQCVNFLHAIPETHGCGVIMPGHPSLRGIKTGEGTSGSVQWENGMRQRVYFSRVVEPGERGEEEYEPNRKARTLSVKKANWAEDDMSMNVQWDTARGLFMALNAGTTETRKGEPPNPEREAEEEFLRLLDALLPGQYVSPALQARNNAPLLFAKKCRLKGNRQRRLQEAMARLYERKIIDAEEYGRESNRHWKIMRKRVAR